jgi:hypothetical protein
LDTALYFATDLNGNTNNPKLALYQDEVITSAATTKRYCFSVTSSSAPSLQPLNDFKVTLVWTDPPGTAVSGYVLINDLDLIVMDDRGKVYYASSGADSRYNMLNRKFDRLNNAEQVAVPFYSGLTGTRNYAVYVYSNRLVTGQQKYGLVVTTNSFDLSTTLTTTTGTCASIFTTCPNNCSPAVDATSACSNGICTCGSGATGVDCSIPVSTLQQCSTTVKRISLNSVSNYVYTKTSSSSTDVVVNVREQDTITMSTNIFVSTVAFPGQVNPSASLYNWTSTADVNTVRIPGAQIPTGTTLYITVTNYRMNPFTDTYTMAFELPNNDAFTPITQLGQTMQGCVAVQNTNKVTGDPTKGYSTSSIYSYYSLTKAAVDAALGSGVKTSAIIRFDLVGFNIDVNAYLIQINSQVPSSVKPTNLQNGYQFNVQTTSYFDIPYTADSGVASAFPTSDNTQINMAVSAGSSGPFTLTVGLVLPSCYNSNTQTINTITPTTISSQLGNGFYKSSQVCQWVLSPSDTSYQHLKLTFNTFALAYGDSLQIYTSSSVVAANLKYTLDGFSLPSPLIFPSTSSLLIVFNSDSSYVADNGFSFLYTPMQSLCPNNCNSNGQCQSNQCICNDGFYGSDCSKVGCPSTNCSSHGYCSGGGACMCASGYWGYNCENICPGGAANPCNGKGNCNRKTGSCGTCNGNAYGPACQYIQCDAGCQGSCDMQTGTCICPYGMYGTTCSQVRNNILF